MILLVPGINYVDYLSIPWVTKNLDEGFSSLLNQEVQSILHVEYV